MKKDTDTYLSPELSQLLLIDHQPSRAAVVQSMDQQLLKSNTLALTRAASASGIPVTLTSLDSTPDAPQFYGPLEEGGVKLPTVTRRTADVWDDADLMAALAVQARRQLVLSGLWTECSVCWSAMSTMRGANYSVFVVTDTCGGTTAERHAMACQRMTLAGAHLVTLQQVLGDWRREPATPRSVRESSTAGAKVSIRQAGLR
ncbi:MAG: isochorismatase family protein [Chromatiales bacterium]|jgi:nicotinamidase-related amidase